MTTKSLKRILVALLSAGAAVGGFADNATDVLTPSLNTRTVAGAAAVSSATLGLETAPLQVKDGSDTLTLTSDPDGTLRTRTVQVAEGTVQVAEGTDAQAFDLSDAVKAKLDIWLSVKDPDASHIVFAEGTSYVEKWHDVRETNVASPTYKYAKADHTFTANGPVIKTGHHVRQYYTVTNSMTALWFGGFGSGVSMNLLNKDGANYGALPLECCAVHGVIDSWGYLFGNCRNNGEFPHLEADGGRSLSTGYAWSRCWGPVMGDSKIWVDGEEVDRATPVHRGFHLLFRRRNSLNTFNGFWQALYSWDGSPTNNRKGGDYLGEIMYFSKRLTDAERNEVQEYLMRKWFGRSAPKLAVDVAAGASVEVSAAGRLDGLDLAVSGEGAFVKKGDGTLVYRPTTDTTRNPVSVDIEGGSVEMRRTLSVAARKGDRITSNRVSNYGVATVTRTAGDTADQIVKDGPGDVTLGAIPDGVTKLAVGNGQLTLRPAVAVPRRYEVPITNGSFEDWGDLDTGKGNISLRNVDHAGWKTDTDKMAVLYNYDKWTTQGGAGTPMEAAISAYGFDAQRPPDGNCAMGSARLNNSVSTQVTIPEAGEYEVSFMLWGRVHACNSHCDISLYSVTNNALVADFGAVNFVQSDRWTQQNLRTMVPAAGDYRLNVKIAAGDGTTTGNIYMLFDDFHLYRVGDYSPEWKIPGGGFEQVRGLLYASGSSAAPTAMSTSYDVAGWTLNAVSYDSLLSIALVNSKMTGRNGYYNGSCYNGSCRPYGGEYQLLFRHTGAAATTTFTPPAGKWYLKCRAGLWSDYSNPKLLAQAVVGGKTVDLGTVEIDNAYALRDRVWAVPFEADGSEVTLTVTYSDKNATFHGVNADDFVLVAKYANDRELIKNGSFEEPRLGNDPNKIEPTGWKGLGGSEFGGMGGAVFREYGRNDLDAFGTDHGSGDFFVECTSQAAVYQDVVIPHPGLYRVSYLLKGRDKSYQTCWFFAVDAVDLDRPGTTNRIDYVRVAANGVFEPHSVAFRVDRAGTYRMLFRGTSDSCNYCIDDISLRYADAECGAAFQLGDGTTAIKVTGSGSSLRLDFAGTNTVRSVRVGNTAYRGVVTRENCPAITGEGALLVKPFPAMLILVR